MGAQIKYKIMQSTMHTFGAILPFNNESEDIKERFGNDIRESITDVQQSWLENCYWKNPVFEISSLMIFVEI